jgi:hypothetical protein
MFVGERGSSQETRFVQQTTAEADDPNGARAEIATLAVFLDSNPPIPDQMLT